MMTITIWKLDEYGYRRKSYEVFRIKGIRQSKDDCDIFYATLMNGVNMRINTNKYDVEVSVKAF